MLPSNVVHVTFDISGLDSEREVTQCTRDEAWIFTFEFFERH